MINKEFIKFAEETIKIAQGHIQEYLGPLPNFRIVFREKQKYSRSDVPFNIEGPGLFVFFREGIRQRLSIPLKKKEMRIYTSGSWLKALIHDLTHLYQELSCQKEYKVEKNRQKYFREKDRWYWLDGLAEYISWKISIDLYKKAEEEGSFWDKRKNIRNITEALKRKKYKLGIKQRIVHLGTLFYFIHKNKGLEKYFILPRNLPKEIKKEIEESIKKKKFSFALPPYAERYFKRALRGEKKITHLYSQYAIGFSCMLRIIKNKNDYKKLLKNPKNNKELMKLAKIP